MVVLVGADRRGLLLFSWVSLVHWVWGGSHDAGLEEAQAGIMIAGRNIDNLRYADDTTLMAESEEEPKAS